MSAIRVIDVQAAWFTEAATGGNTLNLRCPTEGTPHAFWADIALDRPRRMRFGQVAWVDGEGIYQATESRPDVCWIAAQDEPLVRLRMVGKRPAAQRGEMADTLNRAALLTRLSFPVTEAERAAFNALPREARADILARMLEAMRTLHQTSPDGLYFVYASHEVTGQHTYCLPEGRGGKRHELQPYETVWVP